MKFLHTSDWHLGQKFQHKDREDEHRLFLDWLIMTLDLEKIDVLIVAGDIFDTGTPPNYAVTLYYRFLERAIESYCRHIVIVGGNHDSPSMLEAPAGLLKKSGITVIGACTENVVDEIIALKTPDGKLEAVIAAVPFLRDRDIRNAVPGEDSLEKADKTKLGIAAHYKKIGIAAEEYKDLNIPIIATGHLYAAGAAVSDPEENKQNNIYVGNMENIRGDNFPAIFSYVALGHIHMPQTIGGMPHIRYSGSPIPLNFGERDDKKQTVCIEYSGSKLLNISEIKIPVSRFLKRIKGSKEAVIHELQMMSWDNLSLPPWVEVVVNSETILPNLENEMRKIAEERQIELMRIKCLTPHINLAETENVDLHELAPDKVFERRLGSLMENEKTPLMETFSELMDWIQEKTN